MPPISAHAKLLAAGTFVRDTATDEVFIVLRGSPEYKGEVLVIPEPKPISKKRLEVLNRPAYTPKETK